MHPLPPKRGLHYRLQLVTSKMAYKEDNSEKFKVVIRIQKTRYLELQWKNLYIQFTVLKKANTYLLFDISSICWCAEALKETASVYSSFRYIVILKYLLPFAESFTGDTQWMNPVTMVTGLSDGGGFSSIFLFFSEDVILAS